MSRSAKSMSIVGRIDRRRKPVDAWSGDWTKVLAGLVRSDHAGDLRDRRAALADLLEPVVAQAGHPLFDGDVADRLGGRAFKRELLDLGRDLHHLVHADPPAIAAAAAAPAADGLVGLQLDQRLVATLLQH